MEINRRSFITRGLGTIACTGFIAGQALASEPPILLASGSSDWVEQEILDGRDIVGVTLYLDRPIKIPDVDRVVTFKDSTFIKNYPGSGSMFLVSPRKKPFNMIGCTITDGNQPSLPNNTNNHIFQFSKEI